MRSGVRVVACLLVVLGLSYLAGPTTVSASSLAGGAAGCDCGGTRDVGCDGWFCVGTVYACTSENTNTGKCSSNGNASCSGVGGACSGTVITEKCG